MKSKNTFYFSLLINFFFAFTLLIFGPYEIFISNSIDFNFTLRDFCWMSVVVAVLYVAMSSLVCTLLPQKLSNICHALVFSFTLCSYIQAMFLNSQMKVLVGKDIHWSIQTIFFNLLIWVIIFAAVFLLMYFQKKHWKKILQFISSALILMQMVALIFLLTSTSALTEEKNGYLSQEGMLELSSNQNVVVFILDYFDGRTMDSLLSKNPNLLDPLDGFTYFPNATSVHSRTYPSIPYLLTGNMCHFNQSSLSYTNEAFEKSDFIPTLYNNQIDVGLYTYGNFIGTSAKPQIRNYISSHLSLKFFETTKYLLKMILYRDMPYIAKSRFSYNIDEINNNVTSTKRINASIASSQNSATIPEYKNFDDEWFYQTLTDNKITVSDTVGNFRFYHLGSCHLHLSNPEPYGARSLEIVYEYLEQMRKLGIYENSSIIIVSDHGSSGGGDTLDLPQGTAVPLLIVKPAGSAKEPLQVSNAPVSHTDFIPTVLNGFSFDYEDYGKTFFDIPENEIRDRYYYYSALYTDEQGEVELREYKVTGDARDSASYHFTGNKWDILYSANIIAK